MELFLIRHGQSANNALGDVKRRDKDPELTELGEEQAEHLSAYLAAGGHLSPGERVEGRPLFDRLYCSPMIRAMRTAVPLGKKLGITPEVWVDIHEMGGIYLDHGGERGTVGYPGQTRGEMAARFPGYALPDEVGEDGWWAGGMESFHVGQGRAIGVAAALRERAAENERIALVSHGGFGSCLLQALGRQLPAEGVYYDHGNTAISRLELRDGGVTVMRYLNRLDHLPEELLS